MFYTIPEGELPLPDVLASNGERSWWWVEFGLAIPYFLISIHCTDEEYKFDRCLLSSRVEDVLHLTAQRDLLNRIRCVQLLSPAYMNGTGEYQLGEVRQIWGSQIEQQGYVFVMSNGTRHIYSISGELPDENSLVLHYADTGGSSA